MLKNLKIIITILLLLLCFITSGCSSIALRLLGVDPNSISLPDMWGSWTVTKVNGKMPQEFEIEYIKIYLNQNGSLAYELKSKKISSVVDPSGIGIWSLKNNELVYTIGNKSGSSKIKFEKGLLTLEPDPIMNLYGQTYITQYSK